MNLAFRNYYRGTACCLILFLITPHIIKAADSEIHLKVSSGSFARKKCIVRYELPNELQNEKHFSLVRVDNGKSIPVQKETTSERNKLLWILEDELPAKNIRKYKLQVSKQAKHPSAKTVRAVELKDDGKQILIKVGDKPVMVYRHAIVNSPIPNEPYYARSGYIHPLYTPSGKIISDDFNPDHAHQHGIMFAWRKILFDARHNNAWDQKTMLGRVEHAKVESITSGNVFGTLKVLIRHVDLTGKQGPVTMLDEVWKIRVFAIQDHFLFDIVSTQTCATKKPVLIEKFHYGGMTIRGSALWSDKNLFNLLTSQGKTRADGNHTRPNWVEMHGALNEERVGVTIFDHPENFRFPQPVRLHPSMPYFCFVPAQLGEFSIEPGKPFISRYRYYIHTGIPDAAIANQIWEDYTHPLQAQVVKD